MTGEKSEIHTERFEKRIDALVRERPSHREILEFLKEVMIEQYRIRPKVKAVLTETGEERLKAWEDGVSLLGSRDLNPDTAFVAALFKRLCKVLSRRREVSEEAKRISQALRSKEINLLELFKQAGTEKGKYISTLSKKLKIDEGVLFFLAGNSLRPIFEAYASGLKGYVDQEKWWKAYCPICGSAPFMAELREEGARFLACSLCGFEWRFARLKCPFCENEDHKKLRWFHTKIEGVAGRVDVCEKCKKYIKTVDIRETAGEEVIPIVEDMGTLYLDVLAQREGYRRGGMTPECQLLFAYESKSNLSSPDGEALAPESRDKARSS